jgi:hypothetical protein
MRKPADYTILPKWAQAEIANLRRSIEEKDRLLARPFGNPVPEENIGPREIVLLDWKLGGNGVVVPGGTRVRFTMPNPYSGRGSRPGYIDMYHEQNGDGHECIAIHGGDSAIHTEHHSSNLFFAFYPKR